MKIRLISDIHLEFAQFNLPVMENESEQVLCICGDLNPFYNFEKKYKGERSTEYFFESLQGRFKEILYVPGNHEYYNSRIEDDDLFAKKCEDFGVKLLQNSATLIQDNTLIVGATLWTDFDKENPISMSQIQYSLNDFQRIVTKNHLFTPHLALYIHKHQLEFIRETIRAFRSTISDLKVVVLTHHAPHYNSIGIQYRDSNLNGAYFSDLSTTIEELKPNYWLHGHVHSSNNYKIFDTTVISNPRGYCKYKAENPDFNPNFIIEV